MSAWICRLSDGKAANQIVAPWLCVSCRIDACTLEMTVDPCTSKINAEISSSGF
jgi:hypothetical protein